LVPAAIAILFRLSRRFLSASTAVKFTAADASDVSLMQRAVGAGMVAAGSLLGLLIYCLLSWANSSLSFFSSEHTIRPLTESFDLVFHALFRCALPRLGGDARDMAARGRSFAGS
jgi:hypothetical protein